MWLFSRGRAALDQGSDGLRGKVLVTLLELVLVFCRFRYGPKFQDVANKILQVIINVKTRTTHQSMNGLP